MNQLTVIGAGPGDETYLTLEAKKALQTADAIWCAARNQNLVKEEKRRSLTPFSGAMDEMERALEDGNDIAALLSGDTGLYSMLPMLKKRFGAQRLKVIPGISSVQLFCARLKTDWQDAKILSAHGRLLSVSALCYTVGTHAKTILLLDNERNPEWVKAALVQGGLDACKLWIGEKLSCEDESIAPYEERAYDPLSVALIINENPQTGLPDVGLKDEAFLRGKTPMTKREIRMQVLGEMKLKPDAVVWDIGAGTGSVSIECARQCPLGEVYAVEREEEALQLLEKNKEKFLARNMTIVAGSAPQALQGLPVPTHVFLGGTGGEAAEILSLLTGLGRPIRLCATAITLESIGFFAEALSAYNDFSACQMSVSRLETLGRYKVPRAQNPVYVFSCTIGGQA